MGKRKYQQAKHRRQLKEDDWLLAGVQEGVTNLVWPGQPVSALGAHQRGLKLEEEEGGEGMQSRVL